MRSFTAAVAIVVMMATGCTRAVQVQPAVIEEARLGARVKTALVNDAELGPRIIEVRVNGGIVTLSGLVGSAAEAERAISLARGVAGVSEVRSQLVVGRSSALREAAEGDAPAPLPRTVPESSATRNRRVAVGASLASLHPSNSRLGSSMRVGPMARLGVGRGLAIDLGLNWFSSDLSAETAETLGRLTIRPMMAGLSYTLNDQTHWALSLSMVAGLALNNFTLQESTIRDGLALDVDNSFAMRPGVSLWYDINSRAAVNVFSGYVITRPGMTFLENGQFTRRSVRADAAVLSVGLAYKLF